MQIHSQPDRFVLDLVTYQARLKEFDKLLVENTRFVASKATILIKNRGQRPALHLPQTSDQTAGAVLALITMD